MVWTSESIIEFGFGSYDGAWTAVPKPSAEHAADPKPRILVLDHGRVVEFGTPWDLLQDESGIFRDLCRQSGEEAQLFEVSLSEAKSRIGRVWRAPSACSHTRSCADECPTPTPPPTHARDSTSEHPGVVLMGLLHHARILPAPSYTMDVGWQYPCLW